MIDLLIEDGRMLTSTGWSDPGYLTIEGEKIGAVAAGAVPAEVRAAARQVISAEGMAVLPGLTNAHTHLSQTFMDPTSDSRGVHTMIGIDATYKPDRRNYGERICFPEVDLSASIQD